MFLKLFVVIGLFVRRQVGLYGMAALGLLYAGIFLVMVNLSNLVRGLDDERIWLGQILLAALCFGWWGGRAQRSAGLIWVAAIFLGLFVVFGHVGNLWPPMITVLRSGLFLLQSQFDNTLSEVPAMLLFLLSWNEWTSALSTVFIPIQTWFLGMMRGEFGFDPIATIIFWSSVLGTFAFWAGWALRRLGQPMMALLPAGVLLAASFSYVRQDQYLSLAGFIGIVLLLIGLTRQYEHERQWQAHHVDFPEDLRLDSLLSSSAIAILVALVAVLVPIINLRQIMDFFTTPPAKTGSTESAEVGASLGLELPEPALSPYQQLADGGLPRLHLLGTGPELSEQIVMMVEVEEADPSQRFYWRSLTYETYTGRGWLTGKTSSIPYREGVQTFPPSQPPPRVVRQHVRLLDDLDEFVFSAGDILTLDWPYSVAWRTPLAGERFTDQFAGLVEQRDYQVDSIVPLVSPAQLRTISSPLPDWVRQTYLTLPEGIPARVYDLAAAVTIAQATSFDRAIALERYLRSITYSLDLPPPPSDQDIVDYFLFDLERGYCDYYATAMVVLARASGLPARLAVGYASGEYDPANQRYIVTAAQAHSWVEIYFEGVGWVPFEPTGGQPEIVRTETPGEFSEIDPVPATPFEPVWVRTARRAGWGVVGVIGLGLLGLAGWNLWDVWRFRHLSPDEMVARLFFHLYPAGERLGVEALAGATPYEFAEAFVLRVSELSFRSRAFHLAEGRAKLLIREVHLLTDYFVRAAYAPDPLTEKESFEALKLWRGLRLRLWQARVSDRLQRLFMRRKI